MCCRPRKVAILTFSGAVHVCSDVGFVGLGTMGGRMAERLQQAGHRLVVYNRSVDKSAPFAARGARIAKQPAEVTKNCHVVVSCLLDDAAVKEVYLGANGLLTHATERHVFVEHGTFSPEVRSQIADRASLVGATFLDAPVTGGPEGARAGTLITMVGGVESATDQVRSLMLEYSSDVVHLGDGGAGLRLKLINQFLVTTHVVSAAIGVNLLRSTGLPVEESARVLDGGWAASTMLRRAFDAERNQDNSSCGAPISALISVSGPIASELASAGIDGNFFAAAKEILTQAAEGSDVGVDVSRLSAHLEMAGNQHD
ncbi:NAD(P)-dependent oxidoreductase [Gordonia mangrovi]|nr:NAD(P)-dependent oxidoreductase [Gordonia mangrovi]